MPRFASSNAVVKSLSSKPFRVTLKDALFVAALTTVATLIIMYIYWNITNATDRNYAAVAARTAAIAIGAQFLYEYTGTNNRIAENSMRYARGSTLRKYTEPRESMLDSCFREVAAEQLPDVTARYEILKLAVAQPGTFTDDARVQALTEAQRKYLSTIADRMTEDVIIDILRNGFDGYDRHRMFDTKVRKRVTAV